MQVCEKNRLEATGEQALGCSCERMGVQEGYLDKIKLLASRTEEVLRIWPHLRMADQFPGKGPSQWSWKNNLGRHYTGKE